jgi:hypothetical protein
MYIPHPLDLCISGDGSGAGRHAICVSDQGLLLYQSVALVAEVALSGV